MKFMGCGDWTEQDQTLTVKSFPGWLLGRPVVNLQELGSVQCLYVPFGGGVILVRRREWSGGEEEVCWRGSHAVCRGAWHLS